MRSEWTGRDSRGARAAPPERTLQVAGRRVQLQEGTAQEGGVCVLALFRVLNGRLDGGLACPSDPRKAIGAPR